MQSAPLLACLLPWVELSRLESRQGEDEGLRKVGPHRRAHEVGQLKSCPRRLQSVARERGARLVQGFDNVTLRRLDGDTLRGERAAAVRSAKRMVRFPFLVQVRPDEDVVEHARLALESPQGAAIDVMDRDSVQLVPARKATVGLDDSFQQVSHYSFFLARRCKATIDSGSQPLDSFGRDGDATSAARTRASPVTAAWLRLSCRDGRIRIRQCTAPVASRVRRPCCRVAGRASAAGRWPGRRAGRGRAGCGS
jgi:hypothetical protein